MDEREFSGFRLQTPLTTVRAAGIPARTLAYIGDSVFELHMRMRHLYSNLDERGTLHGSVVKLVCAENQASFFDSLTAESNESEKALLRRWRNAKLPKKSLSMHRTVYARSTAVEAWVGYLFLTAQNSRLEQLIQRIFNAAKNPTATAPEEIVPE